MRIVISIEPLPLSTTREARALLLLLALRPGRARVVLGQQLGLLPGAGAPQIIQSETVREARAEGRRVPGIADAWVSKREIEHRATRAGGSVRRARVQRPRIEARDVAHIEQAYSSIFGVFLEELVLGHIVKKAQVRQLVLRFW